MAAAETQVISLKLLIDAQSKRVLFAEAGKDFVDFLFQIQCLPVGTVVSLLRKQGRIGSLTSLYESMENLNDSYMQSEHMKCALLKPVPLSLVSRPGVPLLPLNNHAISTVKRLYKCYTCPIYVSDGPNASCPGCWSEMKGSMVYVAPPTPRMSDEEVGFVKDMVTYMVMDDLVVTPLSTISSMAFLRKLDVKDFSAVEETMVNFGMDEAVKLLNASLHTNNVLSDVFLNCTSSKRGQRSERYYGVKRGLIDAKYAAESSCCC